MTWIYRAILILAFAVGVSGQTQRQQIATCTASIEKSVMEDKPWLFIELCTKAIRPSPKTKSEIAGNQKALGLIKWWLRNLEILAKR